ncbi:DUF4129 domain-containing protein [Fodinibius salinus]|uniref:DUF4129 domain-containing protein n=1 Tax=Fodinibius salinus TaxID=860790 RepID=UPI0011E69C80|nr:DUF4129 domain-containing protein [Fodinibius salinus]
MQPSVLGAQQTIQTDSTAVEVRQPAQEDWAEYSNDEAFNYGRTPKEEQSLLNKIKSWIGEQLNKFFSNATIRGLLKILLYVLFGGLIILLINQYLKGNLRQLFAGSTAERPQEFSINQAENETHNWDRLVTKAIDNQQYRLAIRYLYQQKLHQLQQGGYIEWKQNKTNHDYLHEIKESRLRNLFREVTRYYEFTEYGGFSISGDDFKHMHSRFKEMTTQMQSVE